MPHIRIFAILKRCDHNNVIRARSGSFQAMIFQGCRDYSNELLPYLQLVCDEARISAAEMRYDVTNDDGYSGRHGENTRYAARRAVKKYMEC
jgi:hypothetical protein